MMRRIPIPLAHRPSFRVPGLRLAAAAIACLGWFSLAGCSRAAVPVQTIPTLIRPTITPIPPTSTPTSEPGQAPPVGEYAVIGLENGSQLPVRSTAGLSGLINGYLTPDQRGLHLSGNSTMLGSSQWVEIQRPDGRTGWVQASSLTEYVAPEVFCSDLRANEVFTRFSLAIASHDGDLLSSLVSDERGLAIRVDWWDPEVVLNRSQVADIFADPTQRTWGIHVGSNTAIAGTFADAILPQLEDVLTQAPALACDSLQLGTVTQPVSLPVAFANLNYYNAFRHAPDAGNTFNWRSWSILIEYIDGNPYLVGLIQFRPQV
jgi:hypothetical protein